MSIADKDSTPRVLGLTFDQWAILAGQMDRPYPATFGDACDLRIDWIKSNAVPDLSKRDEAYAHKLFEYAREHNVRSMALSKTA